jgi:hypothetical protein
VHILSKNNATTVKKKKLNSVLSIIFFTNNPIKKHNANPDTVNHPISLLVIR